MPPKVEGFQDGPDAVGVDLYVGRTHNFLCPVVAMLRYLAAEVNSKEKGVIGERAKRARHSQVCSIENHDIYAVYIYMCVS